MNALTTVAGTPLLVPHNLTEAITLSDRMARAKLVPAALQNSPGDCLLVIEQAMRWGMSPFAVAQEVSVIQGKLMYSGKIVAAAIQTAPGVLSGRLSYDYEGEGDNRSVIVTGTLRGESKPRSVKVRWADAATNNVHWKKQPDQQLAYHGSRVWGRRYVPEVMLGVYAPEEFPQEPFSGTTIEAAPEPAQDRSEQLARAERIIDRGQPRDTAAAIGDDIPDALSGRDELLIRADQAIAYYDKCAAQKPVDVQREQRVYEKAGAKSGTLLADMDRHDRRELKERLVTSMMGAKDRIAVAAKLEAEMGDAAEPEIELPE